MSSRYEYSGLKTGSEIRVMELSPGEYEDPEIHCKIKHITLEPEKFDAVSYTWGDYSNRPEVLYCNDRRDTINITSDCYNMIRRLRREKMTVTIWIDAICINQDDNDEKNQQVQMMGKIYATSRVTVIYIGDSTPGSEVLF